MTLPPSDPPKKTYFFENFSNFQVSSKSRFLGAKGGHGLKTFYKVLKYMGEDGFIILGAKRCLILRNNREAFNAPFPSLNPTRRGLWN